MKKQISHFIALKGIRHEKKELAEYLIFRDKSSFEVIVKYPLCGKIQQTRRKVYFRCCRVAWDIEKHRVAIPDEARYRAPKKTLILEEYLKGISKDEIRKLVKEVMEERRQEGEI